MSAPAITKMNATSCHAPWQTEHDFYLAAAFGDGCDARVVKGWTALLSECCRLFIGGGTIQEALDTHEDEFLGLVQDLADEDKWTALDNTPERRPHSFEYDGYGFTIVMTLLTEPPATLPLIDPAVTVFNFHDAAGAPVVSPATTAARKILELVRDTARAAAESGTPAAVDVFGMTVHAIVEAAIIEAMTPRPPIALTALDLKMFDLPAGSLDLGEFRTAAAAVAREDKP